PITSNHASYGRGAPALLATEASYCSKASRTTWDRDCPCRFARAFRARSAFGPSLTVNAITHLACNTYKYYTPGSNGQESRLRARRINAAIGFNAFPCQH